MSGRLRFPLLVFLSLTLTPTLILPHSSATPTNLIRKEALIRFADVLWLKVSVEVPSVLIATREYEIPLRVRVVEVDGELLKFFIKGIKLTVGSASIEYVPDSPVTLGLGGSHEFSIRVRPRFFAANMAPGDSKDSDLRIDFAYYLEARRGEREVVEAGLYTVFASIPVRVLAPRTYVYVQPRLNVTYEPYVVNFTVRVWVEGEGFIENARVEVAGAPVQCYLLTTGRMEAGEERVVWTIMNVSELGPLAGSKYSVTIRVAAATPWGYVYQYEYPFTLTLRKVRGAEATIPDVVAAYAYTPVSVSLNPPPERGERVRVDVYWGEERVYSTSLPARYLVLAPEEGLGVLKVRFSSEGQAPVSVRRVVKAVIVKPRLEARILGKTLRVEVIPLLAGSAVSVVVKSGDGANVYTARVAVESMSKRETSLNGIPVVRGTSDMSLDLESGDYDVLVYYETPLGVESKSLKYKVGGERPLPEALGTIPPPLLVVGLLVPPVIAATVWLLKTKAGRRGES